MNRYLETLFGPSGPNLDGHVLYARPPFALTTALLVFAFGNLLPLGAMALITATTGSTLGITFLVVIHPVVLMGIILALEGRRGGLASFPLIPIQRRELVVFALLWPVVLRFVAVIAAAAQAPFGLVAEETNNPLLMDLNMGGLEQAIVVASVVLLIPVAEEFFYRDVLYRSLRRMGPWPAAALSSLFWAIMHGSLAFVLPLFLVGILLAMLYESTGNLWAPIIAHVGFNLSSFLLVLLLPMI